MPSTRPYPTPADRAEAERIAAEEYADCPRHLARNRDRIVSYFADCVMQKRMAAEHKAAEQHSKRRAA